MKLLRKTSLAAVTLAVVGGLTLGFSGVAKAAACQFQYTDTNFQTSTTPVFNSICGVPTLFNSTDGQYAFGDETDFVRIRSDVSGNDTSNKTNPKLVGGTLTSACDVGDKFDVLTYIHNDASQDYNNNGSGSAVAHNVKLAIDAAGVGTTNDQFKFTSAITADAPAVGATDSAVLDCNGHQVKLTLVPGSVHYNTSFDFSTNWGNMPDGAVNGTTTLGSPTWGSGNQWGCWEYLSAVVYQVRVEKAPTPPPSTGMCTEADITKVNGRTYKVTAHGSVNNATIIDYKIDFGEGTPVLQQTSSHTYPAVSKQYAVKTYVEVKYANGDKQWLGGTDDCAKAISVTITPKPPVTPPELPNTGAGDVIGLFAAITVAGAFAHRLFTSRRLTRE